MGPESTCLAQTIALGAIIVHLFPLSTRGPQESWRSCSLSTPGEVEPRSPEGGLWGTLSWVCQVPSREGLAAQLWGTQQTQLPLSARSWSASAVGEPHSGSHSSWSPSHLVTELAGAEWRPGHFSPTQCTGLAEVGRSCIIVLLLPLPNPAFCSQPLFAKENPNHLVPQSLSKCLLLENTFHFKLCRGLWSKHQGTEMNFAFQSLEWILRKPPARGPGRPSSYY